MTDTTYASYTRDTTERLKAIVHGRRYDQMAAILRPGPHDVILDYGCADGHLFTLLTVPKEHLVGYDPDAKMIAQASPKLAGVALYTDSAKLVNEKRGHFSLVACVEVCEHMTEVALHEVLLTIATLSAPGARVIFGVPIETGLPGLVKHLYRAWKGRNKPGMTERGDGSDFTYSTFGTALRAFWSRPIRRAVTDTQWHGSHTGFNDRMFAKKLTAYGFRIVERTYLPFPILGRLMNNEIYYVCEATQGS
jgi:hypothetical protein